MAQAKLLTGSVEHLAVAPNVEPFPPREVQRLRGDGTESADELNVIAGQVDFVVGIGLNVGVDSTDSNVGVELVEVVAHADVFAVLVDGRHLNAQQAVVARRCHVERATDRVAWMHQRYIAAVLDLQVVL